MRPSSILLNLTFICFFGAVIGLLSSLGLIADDDVRLVRVLVILLVCASIPVLWISGNEKLEDKLRSIIDEVC